MELLLLRKKTEEAWAGHKEAVSIQFLLPVISLFWISFAPIIAKSKIIEKKFDQVLDNWNYDDPTPCAWRGVTCEEIELSIFLFSFQIHRNCIWVEFATGN
ncbi:hypothetical protein LXL04_022474 [Taraxacum kok-saghyz]